MKVFINALVASKISNDQMWGTEKILDIRYACPELFAVLFEEVKLIGGLTFRKNIIGFPGSF